MLEVAERMKYVEFHPSYPPRASLCERDGGGGREKRNKHAEAGRHEGILELIWTTWKKKDHVTHSIYACMYNLRIDFNQ